MLIRFQLNENGFSCLDASVVANAPTINYLKCRFDFKKYIGWKDVDAVTAIFKSPTYNVVAEVMLDSYNECYVDPEVYKRGGLIQCKLIGDKYVNGQIISSSHVSEIAEFYINENVIIPTPTPSKYDVFVAELEMAEESVEDVISELNRKVENGEFDGADGTSISTVVYNQDGTVTVYLEDGRSFTSDTSMKGEKGDTGDAGSAISNITYGQDGTVVITLNDGNTFTSEYSMKGEKGAQGDRGERGYTGERGFSILYVGAMSITNYTDPEVPAIKHRRELSEIMSRALVDEVLVGDIIETAFTITNSTTGITTTAVSHYHILKVDDTYAYFGTGISLKGAKGDKGDKGDPGDVTTVTQTLTSGTEIGEVNGTKLYAPGIKAIFMSPDTTYTIAPSATERISFTSDEFSQFSYHMLASVTFRDSDGVSDKLAICGISEIHTGMRITVKNISSDSITLSRNSKVQVIEI